MSMQLCAVDPPRTFILPPSDVDKMKAELAKIDKILKEIEAGNTTDKTFKNLKDAIEVANEIVLTVDNSNDFFKIGGFNRLLPLLACSDSEVVAATAELIADLCQNNAYCQTQMLDLNVMPELLQLMEDSDSPKVCFKALYALSCLCRHNEDALKQLEISRFLPLIVTFIQNPDKRLKAKAAFFLSYLASKEYFREALYQADIVRIGIELLRLEHDWSTEHVLGALQTQVSLHKQSRVECRRGEYGLKQVLQGKMQQYESSSAYDEAKQHCAKILEDCFQRQE